MTPNLLPQFAPLLLEWNLQHTEDALDHPKFTMAQCEIGGRSVQMIYAPFDHINYTAKIVIVGMTPGRSQAVSALRAASSALVAGDAIDLAAEKSKIFASFSGEPMRSNLIRMLDLIGVAKLLGVPSTAALWSDAAHLVHFTSALRYPVFVDGQNWSGQPDMVRTPQLRSWLEAYTGTELSMLHNALVVPLGPKVSAALRHLANEGMIDASRVLDGLPHPSGANAERIAYFVGDKARERCSSKTNTASLDHARERLVRLVMEA
ncbi:hypothetical protein ABIC65_001468 [Sphingomonas trueperi]|uniref:hypothetical protein n=1 Tax=Sphingomonas trueperi TaxID=53317 RepID=UPI00339B5F51